MASIGIKNVCFRKGLEAPRASRNCHLDRTFLDFSRPAAFNAGNFRKDVLFDPPTGRKRPEANARQRYAPSGANVFEYPSLIEAAR